MIPRYSEIEVYMDSLAAVTRQVSRELGLPAAPDAALGVRSVALVELCTSNSLTSTVATTFTQRLETIPIPMVEPANLLPSIDPARPGPYLTVVERLLPEVLNYSAGLIRLFYDC